MRLRYLLAVLIGLSLPVTGYAEFYQYKDTEGAIKYTDDLSQVPENLRPKVKRYTEPDDTLAPVQKAENILIQKSEASFNSNEKPDAGPQEGTKLAEFERLNQKKAELDREYVELMKEKDFIIKAKQKISNKADLKAYNVRIVDLNERISEFEKKRLDFSKEVDAFKGQPDRPESPAEAERNPE